MLTQMSDADWEIVVEAFQAARSRRGDKGRDDRKFLKALQARSLQTIERELIEERCRAEMNRNEPRSRHLASANLLIREDGADAEIVAARRADEMLERADRDGQLAWCRSVRRSSNCKPCPRESRIERVYRDETPWPRESPF